MNKKQHIVLAMVITLLLLCLIPMARADDAVFFGVYTKHLDNRSDVNEDNQIIGIKYRNFFATTFENSDYNRSWFLGYYFETKRKKFKNDIYVKGNLYLGASYGYDDVDFDVGGWYPAAVPTFEIGYKRVSLELLAWPSDGGVISSLVNIKF